MTVNCLPSHINLNYFVTAIPLAYSAQSIGFPLNKEEKAGKQSLQFTIEVN